MSNSRIVTSPSRHRDLGYQNTRLPAPIVLEGKIHKKVNYEPSTLGRWENLISKTYDGLRQNSPRAQRNVEYNQAKRTIHPETDVPV